MEKVITVGVQRRQDTDSESQASMEELDRLVQTAGGVVAEAHLQKRDRPDPATFVGRGKAEELAARLRDLRAHTLVFDDELKPGQQHTLEEFTGAKVIDRTRLILDIFAQRARTREGQLQVELAQLEYRLPRMTQKFGRFEQQTGGIGTRGPGERKLEVDRRRVRDRLALLQKQIEKVRQERRLQRGVRRSVPVPQVALIGYTNAGKSTLLNRLMAASALYGSPHHPVYADDKLFATLDPTTRRVRLPGHDSARGRTVLFTDTVGFIQKLPTQLVAAFRATLEEIGAADLLLHVVDGSNEDWRRQESAVHEIVKQLHLAKLPVITAYNKMDRLSAKQAAVFGGPSGIPVSASTGWNVAALLKAVEDQLAGQWIERDLWLTFSEGSRLSQLHETMDVLSQETTEKGIRLRVRTHPATLAQWNHRPNASPSDDR
ncbi:MAG TPA: GTPase HflX [Elusimicrobiota bacterium]|nr:GTPase HflX [Elusimicrobiota bacterium]